MTDPAILHSANAVCLRKSFRDAIRDAFFTGMVKPYKGGKYALMALLPKKFGRQYLHKALEQMNLSGLYLSRTRGYIVNVTMPEFTADFDEKMNDYCEKGEDRSEQTWHEGCGCDIFGFCGLYSWGIGA